MSYFPALGGDCELVLEVSDPRVELLDQDAEHVYLVCEKEDARAVNPARAPSTARVDPRELSLPQLFPLRDVATVRQLHYLHRLFQLFLESRVNFGDDGELRGDGHVYRRRLEPGPQISKALRVCVPISLAVQHSHHPRVPKHLLSENVSRRHFSKVLLHLRVPFYDGGQLHLRDGVHVDIRQCVAAVATLLCIPNHILPDHHVHPPQLAHDGDEPLLDDIHQVGHVGRLDDGLVRREGFVVEGKGKLDEHLVVARSEKVDGRDPAGVELDCHLSSKCWAHLVEKMVPILKVARVFSVSKVGSQA
mmetsp:Transcript_11731/g.38591  ORF Transcript_11731/g.38591 Transcript_11731/m.38591 type:complete len:305 (-) Transcript_11731:1139-2053(-)